MRLSLNSSLSVTAKPSPAMDSARAAPPGGPGVAAPALRRRQARFERARGFAGVAVARERLAQVLGVDADIFRGAGVREMHDGGCALPDRKRHIVDAFLFGLHLVGAGGFDLFE